MGRKIITLGDNEIEKRKFHRYKNPIFLKGVNIDNMLISTKFLLARKIINTLLVTWMMIIKLN